MKHLVLATAIVTMTGCVGTEFREAWDSMTPTEQVDQGVSIAQDVAHVALPPGLSHAAIIAIGAFGTWYGNRKGRVRGREQGYDTGRESGVKTMVRVIEKSIKPDGDGGYVLTKYDLAEANRAMGVEHVVEKIRHP